MASVTSAQMSGNAAREVDLGRDEGPVNVSKSDVVVTDDSGVIKSVKSDRKRKLPLNDMSYETKKKAKKSDTGVEHIKSMYKWGVEKTDKGNESSLKMTFKKVPKTPDVKKRLQNLDKINKLKSNIDNIDKGKNLNINKSVIKNNEVLFAKPQPFRVINSDKHNKEPVNSNAISSKTGLPYVRGKGGKLKPVKHSRLVEKDISNDSYIPLSDVMNTPQHSPITQPLTNKFALSPNNMSPIEQHTPPQIPVTPTSPTPPLRNRQQPVPKPYTVFEHKRRFVVKYGVEEIIYKIRFTEEWLGETLLELHEDIHEMFEDVLDQVKSIYEPDVRCRLYLRHDDLQYDKPIFIALRPIKDMSAEAIMLALIKVLNSNQSLKLDDSLIIHIGIMDLPRGGGFKKLTRRNAADLFNEKFEKRSIVNISRNKKHPTCAARAIIVALAELKNDKYYNNIRNPKRREQYDMAFELLRLLDLPTDREIEIRDFKLFEDFLDIQIIVYNRPFSEGCIYTGSCEKKSKIFLYYEKNHFDVIASITGFLSRNYYCETCRVPYSNTKTHSCEVCCHTCESRKCLTENPLSCRKCHQLCRSLQCFDRHQQISGKKKINSLCDRYFACTKCSLVLPSAEKLTHVCHTRKCRQCHQRVPSNHLCYMRAKKSQVTNGRFFYFDFECNAEKIMSCEKGYKKKEVTDCVECAKLGFICFSCLKCANCNQKACNAVQHQPNFVVSHTVCRYCEYDIFTPKSKCMHCGRRCQTCWGMYQESKKKYDCTECCGFRETVFKGENTLPQFMQYLFSPQNHGMTIVAHNGGKYDYSFILEWIISELYVGVKTIYSGAQIKSTINEYKMRFIDSLLFFPMALRDLPKSFDLQCKKGEFPHLFNIEKNYNYIGPYPDVSFYSPDTMSKKCRDDFLKWYATQQNEIFNFQKEILEYCRADVSVLRESCTKFRSLMMGLTCDSVKTDEEGLVEYVDCVDPLASTTLAGMCLNVFRTKFLKESYKYVEPPLSPTPDITNKPLSAESDNLDTSSTVEKKIKRIFDYSPIGVIPAGGYSVQDKYSKKSLLWLELLAKRSGCKIQHALNGGEHFVGGGTNYRVDGWCEKKNTIYEFYGDIWHGCPSHTSEIKGHIGGISSACRYAITIDRMNVLKKMGYVTVFIWECEFDEMLNNF